MASKTTIQDEPLDLIVLDHYGSHLPMDEFLKANPHIAAFGPIIPAGVTVEFPDVAVVETRKFRRLFD